MWLIKTRGDYFILQPKQNTFFLNFKQFLYLNFEMLCDFIESRKLGNS